LNRNQPGISGAIHQLTAGIGADAVIITAGASSLDPVEFAGEVCRKKGKVVIVGAVPTGFGRANYYRKELELRMSCSYGPGRYDADYEEKGIDYPVGYVRWTENRNMQAFVDLLSSRKINLARLITHTFPLQEASAAYQMILSRSEPFNAILIEYDHEKPEIKRRVDFHQAVSIHPEAANVGLIGAGSFAQNAILPRIKGKCQFVGVATAHGNNSRYVADKHGFAYCTDDFEEILSDERINTIFVATRHHLHAQIVLKALQNRKHVFVEKPLAMNGGELEEIKSAYTSLIESGEPRMVMVGFNRRFSPLTGKVKTRFSGLPLKSIAIRVNAGVVPPEHWVHDPLVGGGRIIGEVCHFIDLAAYLAEAPVTSVSASALDDPDGLNDTVSVNLAFKNGSVGSIAYFSNGNKLLPKERIEVFANGEVAIIDDFQSLTLFGKKKMVHKLKAQDKGHAAQFICFLEAVKKGGPVPIPFEESCHATEVTLRVVESLKTRQTIEFD
jgi:predicted dehydrogenase